MRKAAAFLLIMLISFPLLYAQDFDSPPDDAPGGDWDFYNQNALSRGDQTFIISVGMVFPLMFINNGKTLKNNFYPPLGGGGSLSYNYFLTRNIFLGGELNGSFLPTIGNNMFYGILLGARAGYQFYIWRLEIPFNVSVGMTWQRFLGNRYYGMFLKGGGAAYFRFNSEWSFGVHSNWYWLPQWTNDSSKNVDGHMVDFLFSVCYHF